MAAGDHLAGDQFASVYRDQEMVPRHAETGEPPTAAYRYAHKDAVKGYQSEGIPRGTYFSIDKPDPRYKARDHELVSVPYSDEHFRSSINLEGEHNLSTRRAVPPEQVRRH